MFKGFENFRNAILIVLGIVLIYVPIVYWIKHESMQCDTVIFIKGESSRDARDVYFSSNGTATIEYCDGSREQLPTHGILRVIYK